MVRRRWRMDPARLRLVHALALRQKGLTQEEYKLRLKAITGRESSKDLKRRDFVRFVEDLKRLPDIPALETHR